ncbi:DMT family transporter [Paucilactobacillus wasatchensis]|uniref:Permease of the drug/metabolite transporter (DMT) superfamily n=1 Tax=Paucilactobacillus wasatchensis TaxID=1335616 RepID=A0A0D0Y5F7_9LACO|nr:DMT family transporter [Paucilactobacillus wasatchensis]KIS03533.1 Permease of the drug/metabolite transporter (DMT) superfamily [Paucilactobacillus wasatchensis]
MKLSKLQANLLLLATAIIWGISYLVVKQATNAQMPAGLINAIRGLIFAALAYLFFHQTINKMNRIDFRIGLVAGLLNFAGYQIQTIGLKYTTPANNAFLTAIYVAIVPFIVWVMFHHKPELKSYPVIALCVIGMMFLTNIFATGFHLKLGDLLTIVSSFFFAMQIVYFGYTATDSGPWIVAFMLGATQGVTGLIWSLLFERGSYTSINWSAAIGPIIILGVFASFGAQTMQIVGQKFTDATPAGLILMTESMFGSFFSILFGFEPFTDRLLIGGFLIVVAILIMQVDLRKLFGGRKTS